MNDCPCDNKCREECDLCKSENDIKIGMERIMNKLPHEESKIIQDILKSESLEIKEKAQRIYRYSEMVLKRKKGPTGFGRPKMTLPEIEKILIGRN